VVASILGVSFQPVPTLLDKVAAEDGCPPAPTETTSGTLTTKEWDGCRDGARVKFITIANWPHQWPLSGALDATAEVLSFFGIN
jgi:poly(3-hydroxybutyrate) depolymerase